MASAVALAGCGADDAAAPATTPAPNVSPRLSCSANDIGGSNQGPILTQAVVAQPLSKLILTIINPAQLSVANLTTTIEAVHQLSLTSNCELDLMINAMSASTNAKTLAPLRFSLNVVLKGLQQHMTSQQIANSLYPLLKPTTSPQATQGLINTTTQILNNLGGGSLLNPLTNLLNSVLNPQTGALSPITSALNQLTAVNGGPLGGLTTLVNQLINTPNQGLEPVIGLLNGLLGGMENGESPAELALALSQLGQGSSYNLAFLQKVPYLSSVLIGLATAST